MSAKKYRIHIVLESEEDIPFGGKSFVNHSKLEGRHTMELPSEDEAELIFEVLKEACTRYSEGAKGGA